jgi:hypothetical protein
MLKMEHIKAYISILQRHGEFKVKEGGLETDIGIQNTDLLCTFACNDFLSAYEICSMYNRHNLKITYKNIHKRVKRLESLGLIELVEMEGVQHGAKYYQVSEEGLFRLFFQHALLDLTFLVNLPTIVEIHGNNSIFETFLYPFLGKETIMATKVEVTESDGSCVNGVAANYNFGLINMTLEYLRDCCMEVYSFLRPDDYPDPPFNIEDLKNRIILLVQGLVMRIIPNFRFYDDKDGENALTTLAQDDRFMKSTIFVRIFKWVMTSL